MYGVSLPFHAFDTKTHTHSPCISYETNSRASSMSNRERLQGRVSTPGETERLGAGATIHHLTQQLVIKPIRYGWRISFFSLPSSLITLRAFWFTSPSQSNVKPALTPCGYRWVTVTQINDGVQWDQKNFLYRFLINDIWRVSNLYSHLKKSKTEH